MYTVNQTNYPGARGRAIKGASATQLAEYQPLQKMLANLTIAGLNASARQALEFYDSNVPEEIDFPLLPRHVSPEITEVHQVSLQFAQRKLEIENRVRAARERHVAREKELQAQRIAELKQGSTGSSTPGAPPAKGT